MPSAVSVWRSPPLAASGVGIGEVALVPKMPAGGEEQGEVVFVGGLDHFVVAF